MRLITLLLNETDDTGTDTVHALPVSETRWGYQQEPTQCWTTESSLCHHTDRSWHSTIVLALILHTPVEILQAVSHCVFFQGPFVFIDFLENIKLVFSDKLCNANCVRTRKEGEVWVCLIWSHILAFPELKIKCSWNCNGQPPHCPPRGLLLTAPKVLSLGLNSKGSKKKKMDLLFSLNSSIKLNTHFSVTRRQGLSRFLTMFVLMFSVSLSRDKYYAIFGFFISVSNYLLFRSRFLDADRFFLQISRRELVSAVLAGLAHH